MARPLRILVVGSLPPPVGGTTVLLSQLVGELQARPDVALRLVDTGPWMGRRLGAVAVLTQLARQLGWADVISVHASPSGLAALVPYLQPIARALGRPLIARAFGGSLDEEIAAAPARERSRYEAILRADIVLVETQQLVENLSVRFPTARIERYANSRPRPGTAAPAPAMPARRFVFIGRIDAAKGVDQLLAAASQLGDSGIELTLYGPVGPDGELIRTRISRMENVHYGGQLDPREVSRALVAADVLVLPTTHAGEGMPGVILEAFSVGRPCIATRWRAIPELVEDGVSGLLISPSDVQALAEAMRALASDRDLMSRLARGARQAFEPFESTRWTARFVEIARSLQERASNR